MPGIFMEGNPVVGHAFRQEYYKDHAEDQYRVISLAAKITVPLGWFSDAQLTREWTRLEPDVTDHKYYVRGIGEVEEVAVRGPLEKLVLVAMSSR